MSEPGKVLLVTGSRSIKDHAQVAAILDKLPFPVTRLIHGGAPGVDTSAGRWASGRDIPVTVVRPDFGTWPIAKHRFRAYRERDFDMVRKAETVVAIWDGSSSGTKITYQYAESLGKLHEKVTLLKPAK
jgi:hypothetical protein